MTTERHGAEEESMMIENGMIEAVRHSDGRIATDGGYGPTLKRRRGEEIWRDPRGCAYRIVTETPSVVYLERVPTQDEPAEEFEIPNPTRFAAFDFEELRYMLDVVKRPHLREEIRQERKRQRRLERQRERINAKLDEADRIPRRRA